MIKNCFNCGRAWVARDASGEPCPFCGLALRDEIIVDVCRAMQSAGREDCDSGCVLEHVWWAVAEIAKLEAEAERLRGSHRRLKAMMPLFQEARDALTAVSMTSAKLRGLDLTLADRMDDVGIPERWKACEAAEAAKEQPHG